MLAGMAFIGGFAWWISRHRQEARKLDPRCWVRCVKRMHRRDWVKLVCLAAGFTLLMLALVPRAAWFTESATGVQLVDPERHPATQIFRISPWLLIGLMLFVPVVEEWLFRGIVLERLRRFGRFPAVMISAFAFGTFHLLNAGTHFYALVPPTVAGLVLGCAYLAGGLRISVLAHIGYNEILLFGLV